MTLEVRELTEGSERWDAVAAKHGTLFHSSEWLRVLEATQGARLLKLGIYDAGRLVGILPLFLKRYVVVNVGASPLVVEDTPYLGVACAPALMTEALRASAEYASTHGVQFLRLLQRDFAAPDQPVPGATCVEKHTHVLDLSRTRDDIWKGMEGNCRTGIRKAEKSGITVVLESSRDCIAPYYEILSSLYAAQRMVTPNSLEFYLGLWDAFSTRGLFVLTARYEGKIVAGGVFLKDKQWAYYLSGASLREHNALEPNRAIQWTAIRHVQDLGALRYDFVGSDIPRLARFKKSFGGDLMTYTLIERASASWVSVARRSFPELKRIANRLRSRIRRPAEDFDRG